MPRPRRRCLDCHALTTDSRCPPCRARRYGWQHQQARAVLLAGQPACHWCGGVATVRDHVEGAGAVPACTSCNAARSNGATLSPHG